MPGPDVLLVDNGSLAPAATLGLREIAAALARRIGRPVEPVSALHSSTIPPGQLGGRAAEILAPALAARHAAGRRDFLVVPLFFGPSAAVTDLMPAAVRRLREQAPGLAVRIAPVLFAPADDRLAGILADHVAIAARRTASPRRVALVDHGSPTRAVTDVRDALAAQLARRLGAGFEVAGASMERRDGSGYDFVEPLLAGLLRRPGWDAGEVIVAMQFLLPGRHAGPDGDVARICRAAEAASGRLSTALTPLVGEHPGLVEILADRYAAGLATEPIG